MAEQLCAQEIARSEAGVLVFVFAHVFHFTWRVPASLVGYQVT